MAGASTAAAVVAALEQERAEADLVKVQARLADGEAALGVRMGTLFAIAVLVAISIGSAAAAEK